MMDDSELKALVTREIDAAIGYLETDTTAERRKSMDYYLRHAYGNEVEGRSQVVTGEVAEAVDGALPQLMRVFTATSDAVRFEPTGENDTAFAEQATTLANWVFHKDNPGFLILHHWFKDALLGKVGIVKAYWEKKTDETVESYHGLSEDEAALLLLDGQSDVLAQDVDETGLHLKVRRRADNSRVVIENVPPEEFLISRRARSVEDAPFVAHRRIMRRGDLVAMGYKRDVVDAIPSGDRLEFNAERLARFEAGELPFSTDQDDVEIFECYVSADFDDSGINSRRRVVYAGNDILESHECDYVPFHTLCPFPVPHKFFGQSMADRVMDIQLVKSTVLRQMLDNLYLTNNYRVGAVEGQVNLDDLLTSTAGGVVRMKNRDALVPLTVQSSAAQSFPMFEYLEQVQARRTGVSDTQSGLDPSVLQNTTATAVAAMMQQAAGKLELIARIFAETGVKSLFRGILQLLCKYQNTPRTIRINGEDVAFDPRQWEHSYDVTINVGLGNGNRQEQIAMLQLVMAKQEEIIQAYGVGNPLVSVAHYRDTLSRLIEMAGFRDVERFIAPISAEDAQAIAAAAAEAPDPTTRAAELLAAVEREKAQLKLATDSARLDIERERMQLDLARKEAELAARAAKDAAAARVAEARVQLDGMRLALDSGAADEDARMRQAEVVLRAIDQAVKALNG